MLLSQATFLSWGSSGDLSGQHGLAALHRHWMLRLLSSLKLSLASSLNLCRAALYSCTGATMLALYCALPLTVHEGDAVSQLYVCRHCAGKGGWCTWEDDASVQHLCRWALGQRPAVVLLDSQVLWMPALRTILSLPHQTALTVSSVIPCSTPVL